MTLMLDHGLIRLNPPACETRTGWKPVPQPDGNQIARILPAIQAVPSARRMLRVADLMVLHRILGQSPTCLPAAGGFRPRS